MHRYDGLEGRLVGEVARSEARAAVPVMEVVGDPLEEEVLGMDTGTMGPGSLGGESSGYLSGGSWSEGVPEEVMELNVHL